MDTATPETEQSRSGTDDGQRAAVDKLAKVGPKDDVQKAVTPEEVDKATEWFMGETPDVLATDTFGLNVGQVDETGEWSDLVIPWTVQAIGRDRIRAIRKAAEPKGRRGGVTPGDSDDLKANDMIATEGTIHPDLRAAAQAMGVANPAMVLRAKLKHKPGLIDQIAGQVLSVSGYDDNDVREVSAAKN